MCVCVCVQMDLRESFTMKTFSIKIKKKQQANKKTSKIAHRKHDQNNTQHETVHEMLDLRYWYYNAMVMTPAPLESCAYLGAVVSDSPKTPDHSEDGAFFFSPSGGY